MEITILEQKERPLLKRSEVSARVFFEQETPSRQAIGDAMADKLGCKREMVIIASINNAFGDTSATVECRCYTDAETMKRVERGNLIEKNVKKAPEPSPEPEPAEEEPAAESDEGSDEEEASEEASEESAEDEPAEASEEDKE